LRRRGTGKLDVAYNHGINPVERDGEHHPEDRREEETADDLAYGVVLEEAIGAIFAESAVIEAFELRLKGWERWRLHSYYLH
jgi:hypothetical protein